MRVAKQHPWVSVTADQGYLWNAQPHLKEAADSLMPEIVKPEISYRGVVLGHSAPAPLPTQPKGIAGHREDAFIRLAVVAPTGKENAYTPYAESGLPTCFLVS